MVSMQTSLSRPLLSSNSDAGREHTYAVGTEYAESETDSAMHSTSETDFKIPRTCSIADLVLNRDADIDGGDYDGTSSRPNTEITAINIVIRQAHTAQLRRKCPRATSSRSGFNKALRSSEV